MRAHKSFQARVYVDDFAMRRHSETIKFKARKSIRELREMLRILNFISHANMNVSRNFEYRVKAAKGKSAKIPVRKYLKIKSTKFK